MIEQVVIRVDSSLLIGTGHVMRCLTLADSLQNQGATVWFICKTQKGDLIEQIESRGYHVYALASNHPHPHEDSGERLPHSHWLQGTQQHDALVCNAIVRDIQPDWLIVDHYGLDYRWQSAVKSNCKRLMVIDDLADRKHCCDLLLDQTYGRRKSDYAGLVPETAIVLLGAEYALLRPEFLQWRQFSLLRRAKPQLARLLVNLGGADPFNKTADVLTQMAKCNLSAELQIVVVMGPTSPHLAAVRQLAHRLPFNTEVLSNVLNMAELMANADLAIGAAGATSWERCCLGLPSILLVLADNQKNIAEVLHAAEIIERLSEDAISELCEKIDKISTALARYSKNASKVTDGMGVTRVLEMMENQG